MIEDKDVLENDMVNNEVDIENVENKFKQQKLVMQSILVGVFIIIGVIFYIYKSHLLANQDYIGGNVIRIGHQIGDELSISNPWRNASHVDSLIFRSLFLTDSTFTDINPSLAEKYEVLDDGVTYVITMRDNQFWSDGEPITADDVLFSFEAFARCSFANSTLSAAFQRVNGVPAYIAGEADYITGIIVDGKTITITLDAPYSNFALMLTQFIPLPKHVLELEDISTFDVEHKFFSIPDPVSSGQYYIESMEDSSNIILKRNEYYTDPISDIETIILCDDYNGLEVDYYATTDPTKMVSYSSMKGYVEHPVEVYFYRYFIFNTANGVDGEVNYPIDDVKVRQAVNHAIDVETIMNEVYFGKTTMVYGGSLTLAEEVYEYNPDKAKQLLIEAGYDFSRPFQIGYYSGDTSSKILVERVASYLENVGLTVEHGRITEPNELYIDADYDMLLKNLSALNTIDWYNEYLTTTVTINKIIGENLEFDELVYKFATITNPEESTQILQELVDLEQELLYKLPLFLLNDAVYINSNRISVPSDIQFGNTRFLSDIRFDEWYVKKE